MASFVFQKQKSPDVTRRYTVELHRDGKGLGRKKQLTAAQMMTPTRTTNDFNYPSGVDVRAPLGPKDVK